MTGYRELVIGGVMVAPFTGYAATALAIVLLLRPVLRSLGFERAFSHPSAAEMCLVVLVLAALIVLT